MRHQPMQAAVSMILAMAIIGLIDNFVTMLAQDVSLWGFQFLRACMAVPILMGLAYAGVLQMRPKRLWAVLTRNGLVALGMLFYFGSLAFMPIAEALAGLFVAPIFVLLISVFVFGETVGWIRSLAVLIGFAGVVVVLGVDETGISLWSLMPAIGGLFYAMGSVATQRLCADEDTPAMLLVLFSLQGVVGFVALTVLTLSGIEAPQGSAGFLLRAWVWPTPLSWLLIAVQAVFSLIGVSFLIRAYQRAVPSFVATFEYSVFIFGPLFAFLLFGQGVTVFQLLGIVMIAGAGILIAVRGAS